jgi:preprotein translocase subunit YajC
MEALLSSWGMIILLVALFALMYFFMIRPRQKQQREHEEMNRELRAGDRVITAGGIYGEIESITEETVILKLESGATMRIARASILGKQAGTETTKGVF